MSSRIASTLVALSVAGLLVAGCGNDQAKQFKQDYTKQRTELRKIGDDLGRALQQARGKSDVALAAQFTTLADRLKSANAGFGSLKPPNDLKPNFERVRNALRRVEQDVRAVARAATTHSAAQARQAATKLVVDAQAGSKAREALDAQLRKVK